MLILPKDIKLKDRISFTTINPRDTIRYEGVVLAISAYETVKSLDDLLPYYQQVKDIKPSLAPIETLTFLTVQIYQDNKSASKVLALDYINESSLEKIEINNTFSIKIYDRNISEANTILDLLASHGFKAVLL